jgi:hypothetical protein
MQSCEKQSAATLTSQALSNSTPASRAELLSVLRLGVRAHRQPAPLAAAD